MEVLFLCVIIFLFILAVFDLSVGVSNDAVNFLNSAVGSRAASFKRILIVASVGVFIGAAMSNGMMEIARHGIFRPEHFSFYDLICIFMAVMVTDIILLDIFNSLGMPTSTTVSMVFELLGATFVVALIKMAGGLDLGLNELLNTEKALSVILGIFLSVAIAFVFGTVVQFLARVVFSFNYRSHLRWKIGIYGGICATAIVYFMLVKGVKDLTFMTPELKAWISGHTAVIIGVCMVFFTIVMQILHMCKVNVLKVIVLMGTFSLAVAFAGNDLVNFIGVPLSGLASYQDYLATGGGEAATHMMDALNGPANTPLYFLIGAGVVMVVSLATSRKARNVAKTEIGLGSQQDGDEIFGSSRIARRLVRWSLSFLAWVRRVVPAGMRRRFNARFNTDEMIMDNGAAFDLVRGSVNLVLAGALIALGTSLKLPLSTTFVTFMVAMGTSLADRAWGRESAVFRITGVISVIGGWFITAGAAFIGAGLIVAAMHLGGQWVMILLAVVTVVVIVRSNRRFKRRNEDGDADALFRAIITTADKSRTWPMLLIYITEQQQAFMTYAQTWYRDIAMAFATDNAGVLNKAETSIARHKTVLKNSRRKETLCLRHLPRPVAIEKSTWFYLSNNLCMNILYNLWRICEVCREHVDNNFMPLPEEYAQESRRFVTDITTLFDDTLAVMHSGDSAAVNALRRRCEEIKDSVSDAYHRVHQRLSHADASAVAVLYVYVNLLQETREMVSSMRKYLRAFAKLRDSDFSGNTHIIINNKVGIATLPPHAF